MIYWWIAVLHKLQNFIAEWGVSRFHDHKQIKSYTQGYATTVTLTHTRYRWIPLYPFTMATGRHYITMLLADCITSLQFLWWRTVWNPSIGYDWVQICLLMTNSLSKWMFTEMSQVTFSSMKLLASLFPMGSRCWLCRIKLYPSWRFVLPNWRNRR